MIHSVLDNNKKSNNKKQQGYVLLLSVIFLSVIAATIAGSLLLLGLGQSQTGLAQRQTDQARGLAEACAETALDNLRQDSSYAGGETLPIGSAGSCNILPINVVSSTYTIQTQATVGQAVQVLMVQADVETATDSSSSMVSVQSWY